MNIHNKVTIAIIVGQCRLQSSGILYIGPTHAALRSCMVSVSCVKNMSRLHASAVARSLVSRYELLAVLIDRSNMSIGLREIGSRNGCVCVCVFGKRMNDDEYCRCISPPTLPDRVPRAGRDNPRDNPARCSLKTLCPN